VLLLVVLLQTVKYTSSIKINIITKMFDRVEIRVKAGDGGNGAISFRREKFVPYGGPNGGDGGDGGNIILKADESITSLRKFKHKGSYRAKGGLNGSGSKKHGRNGEDLVLMVPPGTVVMQIAEDDSRAFLADLEGAGDELVAARGGKGGWGNTHYATSTNQTPRFARRGDFGEELNLQLEMRIIADVGIIGYPNAGKSTLLARATAARPKIASYPFTTLEPVLGVVESEPETFVMAEIPGLIEGAHQGRGLGHDFLRHIMRTRILIHLIDGSSEAPVEDMVHVNDELILFDADLRHKLQVVAVNKIDLPGVQDRLPGIKEAFKSAGVRDHYISAETGEGVPELMAAVLKVLASINAGEQKERSPQKIFRPQPKKAVITVTRVGDEFVLSVPDLERLMAGAGLRQEDLRWQYNRQLTRMGLNKALESAGARRGDKVRCGDFVWKW
jgi:GTP-binding protein